ncbi:MAG: PKD domain-containing protein [Thermoplasmata archaeon]|nr:PKD domain-containing protein [Thermoplasmata archaeon]
MLVVLAASAVLPFAASGSDAEGQHSDIMRVYDIGDSWEKVNGTADRDILAVKISDNVETDEDEPEALVIALHHGGEWPGMEVALSYIENVTDDYGNDTRVSWLVDNRETWVVPVVNPDGLDFAMHVSESWRKNRHWYPDYSTYGVDLNRNYDGSQNGDPDGEWGGAGTSDDPASSIYCGETPFSEPETQAVRDLVNAHDFQIAIDFHTSGDLVMWPWNYDYDLTPDDADLVRIGEEMAALNGYTPEQGVVLYATTGDSTDWMYGGADVYPYCIEIGSEQHPDYVDDVIPLLDENYPVVLLAMDLAGDREERDFDISHTPVSSMEYSASGFTITADITAGRGVDTASIDVYYSVDGGTWGSVPMTQTAANDTYEGIIPSQTAGSVVEYYIVAHDLAGVEKMSPTYAPYDVHTFTVTSSGASPTADAGADIGSFVGELVSFDGTLSSDDFGIVSYVWEFTYNGSTTTLTGAEPTFTFWTPGIYDVTLTVTDGDGLTDVDHVTVTVTDTAIPEFGTVVGPVVATALVFFAALYARRRRT